MRRWLEFWFLWDVELWRDDESGRGWYGNWRVGLRVRVFDVLIKWSDVWLEIEFEIEEGIRVWSYEVE